MAYTTIDDPSAYFKVQLYTGNATDATAITFDDTDTDMQPDMVWLKNRSASGDWSTTDSARGVTKTVISNGNDEEQTYANGLQAFGSDGFTVGTQAIFNGSGNSIVAHCWKETADAGFDMVLYTGNETARTIAHSLSAKPGLMIVKRRGTAVNWQGWHKRLPDTGDKHIYLN